MSSTVTVLYSCDACGLFKRPVAVPARAAEDIIVWMEQVMAQAVSDDHRRVAPCCQARSMSEFWIPLHGTTKIGGVLQ